MSESYKNKLLKGMLWNTIEKVLIRASSFIIGIVLARLLSPSDYGLVGVLTVFITLSNIIIEGGFVKAIIQKQQCEDIDYSTVFITNVALSIVIYLTLHFAAPYIASFYNEPILTSITRVLGLNIIIGSFNIIQRAKLMKAVDFKSLAKINVASVIVGGSIGIILAYNNYGVWSLIAQSIASSIVQIFLFRLYSKFNISLRFSISSFKQLFRFGSKLMLTGCIATIVNNIANLSIGKFYNTAKLGYYTRAYNFSEITSSVIYDVIGTVSFPILSELQSEREHLISLYKKSLFYTSMFTFPVMIMMALLAKPIVAILLTEKWLPCVFLMQILCLSRMFTPLSAINMNVLNALGRSDLYMKLDLSKIPLDIILLAIAIPISVEAIVIANLFNSFICFFINAYLPGKILGYGALKQLKDWRYIILSNILMVLSVLFVKIIIHNYWGQLIIGGIIGLFAYTLSILCFKVISFKELLSLLKISR